jgi:hypothetical protein
MSIARDEIFGPVMCTFKFKTLEEVGKSYMNALIGRVVGLDWIPGFSAC